MTREDIIVGSLVGSFVGALLVGLGVLIYIAATAPSCEEQGLRTVPDGAVFIGTQVGTVVIGQAVPATKCVK